MDAKFRKIHNYHTEFMHYVQFHVSNSNIARYGVVKTANIRNSECYIPPVRALCYINWTPAY